VGISDGELVSREGKQFNSGSGGTTPGGDPVQLTDREREIARLVAAGHTNAEIGAALFISAGTVKNHVAAVQHKVGARNRVGIAAWAGESGLATG
jgi:DNA-binding CsgD family transcriptional regulator